MSLSRRQFLSALAVMGIGTLAFPVVTGPQTLQQRAIPKTGELSCDWHGELVDLCSG